MVSAQNTCHGDLIPNAMAAMSKAATSRGMKSDGRHALNGFTVELVGAIEGMIDLETEK